MKLRTLTDAMLRGPLPTRTLARLTGYAPKTIRERRLGIPPQPRPAPRAVAKKRDPRAAGRPGAAGHALAVAVLDLGRGRIARALQALAPRSALVLRRRLLADVPETFSALGRELGMTRERVRQIEKRAFEDVLRSTLRPAALARLGIVRLRTYRRRTPP